MAVNKVVYAGNTLVDLTNDTVTADILAEGATAHTANGERVVGAMTAVQYGKAQSLTDAQKEQARENIGAASAEDIPDIIPNWRGEWNELGEYFTGDAVSFNGSSYVLVYRTGSGDGYPTGFSPEDSPEDWVVLAAKGGKGDKGDKGDTYTLTSSDKSNIAASVKASLTTETWTFTLADGSTVTKKVLLG